MSAAELAEVLRPLAALLEGLDLSDPAAARAELEARAPFAGALVASARAAAEAGAAAGWLLPRENAGVRFGRVAKDLCGQSVDAVFMHGPGPRHRHPNGEVDLCFAQDEDPRFDGHPEGWVVYGPDSTHVPTVRGGSMLILYFLPGGAIEFTG
ncbi:MAG: DUF4863 family protein [Planctomycetota bacterium]